MFEEWMTNRIYFLYLCLLAALEFMILEWNINRHLCVLEIKLKCITISYNNVRSSGDSLVTLITTPSPCTSHLPLWFLCKICNC
jgi:hypothetical protein